MPKEPCPTCSLVHGGTGQCDSHACMEAQAAAMLSLLEKVGQKRKCTGCPAIIYMVRHSNGANVPYTPAGLNHFVDCVARDQFKRRKGD